MDSFLITTAIDFVNAKPHLGHVYEKVGADVAARYHKLRGEDAFLLIGADEHSLNISRNAQAHGVTPQEFCDAMAPWFKDLYRSLGIDYSRFIRTTEAEHQQVVKYVVQRLGERGYITEGVYAGHYCESCEAFVDAGELRDGKCPYHPTKEVAWVEEANYFFTLSRFAEPLQRLYREHPGFLQPETWRNEVLGRLQAGLKDISISRAGAGWGIAFPQNPDHVVYVWFDALLNYLTGSGFLLNEARFAATWPPRIQVIGKDITWFHGIIWPAILMALELPLPERIFAHGHLLRQGQKLSKSAGVVIDPGQLIGIFGVERLRYYLMKGIAWGQDGNFSTEGLVTTCNNDLSNDFGNLISRTTAMIEKFFEGYIPGPGVANEVDRGLREAALQTLPLYHQAMEQMAYVTALETVFALIGKANRYIELTAPWQLAKEPAERSRLGTVLYQLTEVIRITTLLLEPFMPTLRDRVWQQLGVTATANDQSCQPDWGFPYENRICRGEPLFPRLEWSEVAGLMQSE